MTSLISDLGNLIINANSNKEPSFINHPVSVKEINHSVGLFHAWSHHCPMVFLKSAETSEGSHQFYTPSFQPDHGLCLRMAQL